MNGRPAGGYQPFGAGYERLRAVLCIRLGRLPQEIDDLDPDHLLSLVEYLEDEARHADGRSRGRTRTRRSRSRPQGEPGEAVLLTPDHPLYRPPRTPPATKRDRRGKTHGV